MKKLLLLCSLFVFPVVAMEAESGKWESSDSYDADDESASPDGDNAPTGKKTKRNWRYFAGRMLLPEPRGTRLAREQSSRRCCFFPFLQSKS